MLRGDSEETIELPIDRYPILLHFPVFSPPALIDPEGYTSGIRIKGAVTIGYGPTPEQVMRDLGVTKIRINQTLDPINFARMIAKIAYAYAAAEDQIRFLKADSTVIPGILGDSEDIGRWVGTLTEPLQAHKGHLHRISMTQDYSRGLLVGEVQLFSDVQTPSYGVILGYLR